MGDRDTADTRLVHLDSRAVLRISGADRRDFLQGLITNSIEKVTSTQAIYAALLTPQGKFLYDFTIAAKGDAFLLDCEAARLPDLTKRLRMYKLRAAVEIEDLSDHWKVFAALGASGLAALGLQLEPGQTVACADGLAITDPRHAALGARIMAPTAPQDLPEGQFQDYEALRLELGVPEGGVDLLPEKSFLLESNFEDIHGVDFKKGCFVGQEVTARTKHKGTVKKRLLQIRYDGQAPAPGTAILAEDREIATVTSASGGLGLALVRLERLIDAENAKTPLLVAGETVTIHRQEWLSL